MKHMDVGIFNIKTLAAHVSNHIPTNKPYLIGIDGLAGSGKTTFLTKLIQVLVLLEKDTDRSVQRIAFRLRERFRGGGL